MNQYNYEELKGILGHEYMILRRNEAGEEMIVRGMNEGDPIGVLTFEPGRVKKEIYTANGGVETSYEVSEFERDMEEHNA